MIIKDYMCVNRTITNHPNIIILGSSLERAQSSLLKICPAVINGGMTTFLALIVLADSTSHAFLTFFKVFFLTVICGMFHGVVLLPVLLSWLGGQNIKQLSHDIPLSTTNGISTTAQKKFVNSSKYKNLSLLDIITIFITGVEPNSDM